MKHSMQFTFAVLSAAPYPVGMPQPSRQTFSNGADSLTLANEIAATTVYSANVDVPMKWWMVSPLHVKRLVPSGMTPLPCVSRIFEHKFVFGLLQNLHVSHCGMYNGMTWSPTTNLSTFSPTLSTMPPPSWPKITGKSPSGSRPPNVYASVWQTPVANTRIRTSFAFGGATSTSSIDNGLFGAQATAALHLITCKNENHPSIVRRFSWF